MKNKNNKKYNKGVRKISFSNNIKLEILKSCKDNNIKKNISCLYGLLYFSSSLDINKIEVKSNLESTIKYIINNIYIYLKIKLEYKIIYIRNKKIYIINSENKSNNSKIIDCIFSINKKNYVAEIIKGAFVISGNISEPQNKYYLEFSHENKYLIKQLQSYLDNKNFNFKYKKINNKNIIYMTNSNSIEDFLTYIGASNSSLEIMNTKVYKDIRNKINRLVNCETSNINKTILASSNQIKYINKIIKTKGFSFLDSDLREIALKRLDNPEMSLEELSKILSFKISKSGLNHKFRKIKTLSEL
ncbi:MAG: DNA-binding protein WhiA [Oscillospiraceae bacterium]|nr:DNA-binding protein WhiA [Oscillospiraceae bacterium]